MPFATIDLTRRVGTELETDVATLAAGEYAKQIKTLLQQRGVVCVRRLHIDDANQLAFARPSATFSRRAKAGSARSPSIPTSTPAPNTSRATHPRFVYRHDLTEGDEAIA